MSVAEVTNAVGANSSRSNPDIKEAVTMEEHEQVLEKLRQCEDEKMNIMKDHGNLIKEFNRRMHVHIDEIRLLKEVNHKLQADMQELRDLCCYLDDDRHKCRKLAREWQRFGRHTATVMRNEVTDYQDRIRFLEDRQTSLSSENNELKELCLYLDQQREGLTRSDICSKCSQSTDSASSSPMGNGVHDVLREKGVRYSEKLETRLSTIGLERRNSLSKVSDFELSFNERYNFSSAWKVVLDCMESCSGFNIASLGCVLTITANQPVSWVTSVLSSYIDGSYMSNRKKRVSFTFPEEIDTDTDSVDSLSRSTYSRTNGYRDSSHPGILRNGIRQYPRKGVLPFADNNNMTPEAVAQAMKVLEIHDKLDDQAKTEPDKQGEKLDENEVAVLKEMCNVS
ncbi:hypothetical protein QZH41_020251 [Actinostola sp. cb2023]|nr:hypothetical protein QZH41_020251 [Actinostola sp. cb2023]